MRLLGGGLGLALVLAGCVSTGPPGGFIPAGSPVEHVEQLSGEYCYFGPDFNVRSYLRNPGAIPFVQIAALGEPTRVSVTASAQEITFRYTGLDGVEKEEVFTPARFDAVWRKDVLEIDWRGGETRLHGSSSGWGIAGSSRQSRLLRLRDGKLIMTDSVRSKGYEEQEHHQNFVFHSDEQIVAVILDPATGDCPAQAPVPQRQKWFGRGPDVRDAACLAGFEQQLAAILVDKGEEPQAAGTLSRTTAEALGRGGLDPGGFFVSSPSGASYGFEVAAKGSSGCVLRLFQRSSGRTSTYNNVWFLAKRQLPGCVCNP